MKELEKTKRISISAVLFLLVILIGFITFKKPKYVFQNTAELTLQHLVDRDYVLTLNEFKIIDPADYVLIDTRSNFEFAKGHYKNAINISAHQVFNDDNKDLLQQIKDQNKTIILYSDNPDKANHAWMLLFQLGFKNTNILCVTTSYVDNKFQIKNYGLEKPNVDYAQIMESVGSKNSSTNKKQVSKKVITKPKKKKRIPEGGC
jgi:rhodanese-related sulfurtransferase